MGIPARLAAALLAVLAASASASETHPDPAERTLLQIEKSWARANESGDAAALGGILADDWVSITPGGTFTKAQAVEDLRSGALKVTAVVAGPVTVRLFGDTAVVTGSNDERSSYRGKDTSGRYLWTDVFVRRQGRWQVVASHVTLVAAKR